MTDIALFPIPNLVAFPGTLVPLHVFEPRYREMVHDAVDHQRMIGICHTRKQIHAARKTQTIEEALSSNQATYQPHEVFSAGLCEIVETTPDGRIHANIKIEGRYRSIAEVQTLPYRIVRADELPDDEEPAEDVRPLQVQINERLIEMTRRDSPVLMRLLSEDDWLAQSPAQFSFKLFQFLRFEPDLMQSILETTRASERLKQIDEVLRYAS